MKIVIIGGVAAGMSAAAKARRENSQAEIIVYEKGEYLSYAACGLPYYVADIAKDSDELIIRTKEQFEKSGIKVFIKHEMIALHSHTKTIILKDLSTGNIIEDTYDKLLIATGASAIIPPFEGVKLKNILPLKQFGDGLAMKKLVENPKVNQITVVGGGYIGIEVAENLIQIGKKVRIIELADRILMPFESEISDFAKTELERLGVELHLEEKVVSFLDKSGNGIVDTVVTNKGEYDTDLVVMAIGVTPNTKFLDEKEFVKAKNGALEVDQQMRTTVTDVYAAGDCALVYHFQKKENAYFPLGTTANKCGKLAGTNIAGGHNEFIGAIGSAAIKVGKLELARTGLSEKEAKEFGYHVGSKIVKTQNRPSYYHGNADITFKIIYDIDSKELLGAQGVGECDTVLRINQYAVGIFNRMRTYEFGMVDLCYAPPFSGAWDAVHIAANVIK